MKMLAVVVVAAVFVVVVVAVFSSGGAEAALQGKGTKYHNTHKHTALLLLAAVLLTR
jgi:hypothetical protein